MTAWTVKELSCDFQLDVNLPCPATYAGERQRTAQGGVNDLRDSAHSEGWRVRRQSGLRKQLLQDYCPDHAYVVSGEAPPEEENDAAPGQTESEEDDRDRRRALRLRRFGLDGEGAEVEDPERVEAGDHGWPNDGYPAQPPGRGSAL